MSFFTDILRDVQKGLRGLQNEIPDQLAPPPQSPEGFEYDPNYEGEYVDMAAQPIEPSPQRTVQSTPDYYGNTIPIDAFPDGLNPAREGGVQKFTNIPNRGGGYELMKEVSPIDPTTGKRMESLYGEEDPSLVDDSRGVLEKVENYMDFVRSRDEQDRKLGGLENEVQARLLREVAGKLSPEQQFELQEQEDIGAVGVERTKGLLSMADNIQTRMLELGTGEDSADERTALRNQFDSIMDLIDRKGGKEEVVPPPLATPDQMLETTGAKKESTEKKINDVIAFITPDADLNVTAKRFIDAARRKGITMKSLGFSKASLREYGTFARWLNEYLINRPLSVLNQYQRGLINERLTGN